MHHPIQGHLTVFKIKKLQAWEFYQAKLTRLFHSRSKLFVSWFDTSPAENFIRVDMRDRKTGQEYILTLQRVRGKNPMEIHYMLEQDIMKYRNALREIGELAWDVRDPGQAKVRIAQISDLAGIADE